MNDDRNMGLGLITIRALTAAIGFGSMCASRTALRRHVNATATRDRRAAAAPGRVHDRL